MCEEHRNCKMASCGKTYLSMTHDLKLKAHLTCLHCGVIIIISPISDIDFISITLNLIMVSRRDQNVVRFYRLFSVAYYYIYYCY